jgi:4-hydroxy-tetrahydrodipicolinate reductase
MTIKVCLAGVSGWTGKSVAEAILKSDDLELVGAVSRSFSGQDVGELLGSKSNGLLITDSVEQALQVPADVFVDYTSAVSVKQHVWSALERNVAVIIGSSGLSAADYDDIGAEADKRSVGVIACGNFAITAALAKHFALLAAKYIPHWEIIDYAHDHKIDAPSGTARELAEALAKVQTNQIAIPQDKIVGIKESRGAQISGTPVHSVRLPSYTLGFETIFGMPDEKILIKHESGSGAGPYVAGTLLAIRRVAAVNGLVRGMDTLLFGLNQV